MKRTRKFSNKSIENLCGIEPTLVKAVTEALHESKYDFGVISGLRSVSEQKQLVLDGNSWTVNSRHLHGCAVDILLYSRGKGRPEWNNPEPYRVLWKILKSKAPIKWGWDLWGKDAFHFELDRVSFPDVKNIANKAKQVDSLIKNGLTEKEYTNAIRSIEKNEKKG